MAKMGLFPCKNPSVLAAFAVLLVIAASWGCSSDETAPVTGAPGAPAPGATPQAGKGGNMVGSRATPEAARNYFSKAADTYKQILATEASKPGFIPNERVKLGVQMRLANCYRRMGAYDEGMELLVSILKQQPNYLPAQIEAAQLLQDRGLVQNPEEFITKAVRGDQKNEDTDENIVWGWSKLADKAATNPKLASTYFEALLRSNECRYLLGMKVGAPRQADLLTAAKRGISSLYAKSPGLGGPELKQQYDSLTRSIQQGLNEPALGLKAFDAPPAGAAPANNTASSAAMR